MDDVKDKLKGFMKKVNLSSSSGKFKGSGRVLGSSSSSGPVNPIHNRFNSPQAPNPNRNLTPRPKPSPIPNPTSSSPSASLPEKPISSGSTRNPDPDPARAPQDGFDPYGSFITSSNRSQNGYSLNMFECPICGNPFKSEEEVTVHVESCIDSSNGNKSSSEDNDKSGIEKLVVVYLSDEIWTVMEVPSEEETHLINKVVGFLENRKTKDNSRSLAQVEERVALKKVDREICVFFSVPETVASRI